MSRPEKTTNHTFVVLMFAALMLVVVGCRSSREGHLASFMSAKTSFSTRTLIAAASQRYIAERHKLEILTSESELQKSWESAVAFCGTVQCEVVSSSITAGTGDSVPSGSVSLRVSPEDLNRLVAYIEKLGKVAEHTTGREDKTTDVVDTDAKIKNLTSFRDNLRAMLSRPSATVTSN